MIGALLIPSFIAGVLTFLAPCTLPLVPGYLGFISGVSLDDLGKGKQSGRVRRKIFLNGLFYVIGFSVVFVILGTLISFLGGALFAQSRSVLARLGGAFVIMFGVFMVSSSLVFYEARWPWLKRLRLPGIAWMSREHRIHTGAWLKPGNPASSVLFGATFALGWTPCVGPVLGAILTLAAAGASVGQGALLLTVFSLGLAVPFLVLAGGIGYFAQRLDRFNSILPAISIVGGFFIVMLGIFVLTNSLGIWISWFFQVFSFINYDALLDYL